VGEVKLSESKEKILDESTEQMKNPQNHNYKWREPEMVNRKLVYQNIQIYIAFLSSPSFLKKVKLYKILKL
jgi:hypothetical protein